MRYLSLVLLLLGCGKGAPDAPAGDLSAKPPREAIVGRWTVDVARLEQQPRMQQLPPEQRKLALEMARGVLRSMTVEFTADGYSMTMGGTTNAGTWKVKSEQGRNLVLAAAGADGEQTEMTVEVGTDGLLLRPAPDEDPLPLAPKR